MMKKIAWWFLLTGFIFSQTYGQTYPFQYGQKLSSAALNQALANAHITSGSIANATIVNSPITGSNGAFTGLTSPSVGFTGGTIDNVIIGSTTPVNGYFSNVAASSVVSPTGHLLISATAPTISSGFGTSPSIVSSNGTSTFQINVGTGGTASTGTIALPVATTGWNCTATFAAAPQAAAIMYASAVGVSGVAITNYTLTTGAPLAWTASKIIAVNCSGF